MGVKLILEFSHVTYLGILQLWDRINWTMISIQILIFILIYDISNIYLQISNIDHDIDINIDLDILPFAATDRGKRRGAPAKFSKGENSDQYFTAQTSENIANIRLNFNKLNWIKLIGQTSDQYFTPPPNISNIKYLKQKWEFGSIFHTTDVSKYCQY